jgi:hypothetical protein
MLCSARSISADIIKQFNRLLPESTGALTRAVIDQSWEECLQRTNMADYLAEFVLAAEAAAQLLERLLGYLDDFPERSTESKNAEKPIDSLSMLLADDLEEIKAIKRELHVLQSKAEHIATAVSIQTACCSSILTLDRIRA